MATNLNQITMNSHIAVDHPTTHEVDSVNILIVDDEPKNLMVLETVLAEPGYRLIRATSGNEALLALMADEFAVLILDIRMPGMSGFELATLIKERKKTARVPIIFLTAYYTGDEHLVEGYGSGAVDYLHKPVNPGVLRSKVAVFVDLFRKTRALELTNQSLLAEVAERRRAEAKLSELNELLDLRVVERTNLLETSEAKLREAGRRKDEFLATLAHELRNPLAPVRNAAQILRLKNSFVPEVRWATEVIDRQIHAMSRLIDDLMDVSRINQGKIELRIERVDLVDVLNDAVETTRSLIDECGHQLLVTPLQQRFQLDADRTRLAQVLMNLLHNAAKYTDKGGRIDVSVKAEDGECVVTVKDTGIGIPPEHLATVFEMFSQVETALSRSRGGLGIGLSLTRRLVEMHKGQVVARSEGPGKGSEFEVRLPLAAPLLGGSEAESATAGVFRSNPDEGQLRILVADDNEDAAVTLAALLEVLGHSVRYVHDGEAAVKAALEFVPDVALLDIGMPKLNGFEACRRIRNAQGNAPMTMIAVTGWGQTEDLQASKQAGFDRHLVKPVDPEALFALLAEIAADRANLANSYSIS